MLTELHATPPTVTVAPAAKPVPSILIRVPPDVGPDEGETLATVGSVTLEYVNTDVPVPTPVSELVTTTFTRPALLAPVVHEREVAEATETEVHVTPPTETVAPEANPVPVTVMRVPPEVEPEVGATLPTVGLVTLE
jgi:hypothetical protein